MTRLFFPFASVLLLACGPTHNTTNTTAQTESGTGSETDTPSTDTHDDTEGFTSAPDPGSTSSPPNDTDQTTGDLHCEIPCITAQDCGAETATCAQGVCVIPGSTPFCPPPLECEFACSSAADCGLVTVPVECVDGLCSQPDGPTYCPTCSPLPCVNGTCSGTAECWEIAGQDVCFDKKGAPVCAPDCPLLPCVSDDDCPSEAECKTQPSPVCVDKSTHEPLCDEPACEFEPCGPSNPCPTGHACTPIGATMVCTLDDVPVMCPPSCDRVMCGVAPCLDRNGNEVCVPPCDFVCDDDQDCGAPGVLVCSASGQCVDLNGTVTCNGDDVTTG